MKSKAIIILFLILIAAAIGVLMFGKQLTQLIKEKQPNAQFDSKEYDLGKIRKADGVVNKNFVITNVGGEKLIIGDITTSCGCTTAKIDNKEILSGEKANITVNFDPNFHEEPKGRFSRSIYIPTNDPDNKEIELKIFTEIYE